MPLAQSTPSPPTERDIRALVRLVDGRARMRDRFALHSRTARSPAGWREAERRHLMVTALLHAGGPQTPLHARSRPAAQAGPLTRVTTTRGGVRWRVPSPATTPLVAAALLVTALVGVGSLRLTFNGPSPPPSVAQVAMLALRRPTSSAAVSGVAPSSRATKFVGVAFPNYEPRFGARQAGQRTDRLSDRSVRTMYYHFSDGSIISYSIVSGAPLRTPAAADQVSVAGIRIQSYREDGLSYVTLVRGGRTCVLSGRLPTAIMLSLAGTPLRQNGRV